MAGGFQHDIAGGSGNLVVGQVQSPNYVHGVSGWIIRKDGTAEFHDIEIPAGAGGATVYFASTAPVGANTGDLWYNTAAGLELSQWDGSAWVPHQIGTGAIAANAITQALIAAGAVGTGQIASAAITNALLASAAVGTSNIASGAVTAAQINAAAGILGSQLSGSAAITGSQLAAAAGITGSQLSSSAGITSGQVSFTARNIGGITTTVAASAPASPQAGDLWYDSSNGFKLNQFASGVWTAYQYGTNAIAAGSVTAALIAANTITAAQIASGTITATQIASATITAGQIAAGTITASQIAAGTITSSLIAANAITTGLLAAGAVTATQIAANTITASQLAAGIVYAGIVDATTITGATIVADGTSGEILIYNGTPASGNLIGSWAAAPASDAFGNAYGPGLTIGSVMVPQVLVIPGSTGGQGSAIAFPFNTTDDTGSTAILGQIVNEGLANQYLQLAVEGPTNANDTALEQFQTLYNSASDDNTQTANMLVVDQAGNIYLGFSNDTSPAMSIGQPPAGASAGLPSTFIPITMNGAILTYASSAGGTYVKTFDANGTIVFPTGVTHARVQNWGSSAGGQYASGPGGGSGEYAEEATLSVTAGLTYTATVPAGGNGGTSGSGTGKSGATATFSQGATNLVVAHGAPVNNTNPSTGGTGSANTIHHNGGGCTCVSTGTAKGGGGGAGAVFPTGTVNNGGSNYGSAGNGPGAGGTGYLGNGGNGGWGGNLSADTSAGSAGGVAAGGGSGGAIGASSGQNGGKGGRAQIIVTYTVPGSTPLASSFASAAGTDASGNAYAAGYTGPTVAVHPASSPSTPEAWQYVLNGTVGTAPTGTTSNAANFIRYKILSESNMAVFNYNIVGSFANGLTIATLPTGPYRPLKQQLGPLSMAEPTAPTSAGPRTIINTNGAISANWPNGTATSLGAVCLYPLD